MSRSRSLIAISLLGGWAMIAGAQPQDTPPPPTPPPPPQDTPPPTPDPAPAETVTTAAKAPAIVTGTIRGRIVTRSGDAAAGAIVTLAGTTASAIVDGAGNFELLEVPSGAQLLDIEATGYVSRQAPVEIIAGRIITLEIRLADAELPGEEIVVVGSRLPEKRLDAPVTIEIVTEKDLRTAAGTSYLAALSRVKGIDFADAGIGDQRISARGFATQFNSRMVTMVDGRLATMPGNGLPQGSLIPTSGLDMKAVEVVVGPASALYGPNAHTGVINIATKTPWDDSGATASLRAGTRSLLSGTARVAGTIADDFGWKVNGEYLRADDFRPDRASGTHDFGTNVFESDLLSDYDVRGAKADATLYYRNGDWLTTAGAGLSTATGFAITNAGRNHLRGMQVQYQAATVSSPHFYGQVTRTATDAGTSYQLDRLARAVDAMGGAPANPHDLDAMRDMFAFVDNSSLIDSELQLRYKIAGVKTTFGGQVRQYAPSSAGTYLDDATREITATEVGGYVQLDTLLWSRLRLAGAARVDHHSQYATQLSPKAAIQYEVAPSHNVRIGYNRAFKSPTVLESFLRISDVFLGNRTGFVIHDASGGVVGEIAPLRPEQVDAIEAGYKGAVGDKLYIDAVAYQSWYRDFISALTQVANPAGAAPTFAAYPDGTRIAAGTPLEGMLSTYLNFGRAKVRGIDVGADYRPIPEITLSASASLLSLVDFQNDNSLQNDLLLNAPTFKLRGSAQVDSLGIENAFARIDGRYRAAYAFESGYWNSMTLLGGKVPSRVVVDVTAGYRLPRLGLTVTGTVSDLLDNTTIDVLGAPVPHRFAWLQVAYDVDGLRY